MPVTLRLGLAIAGLLVVPLSACGSDDSDDEGTGSATDGSSGSDTNSGFGSDESTSNGGSAGTGDGGTGTGADSSGTGGPADRECWDQHEEMCSDRPGGISTCAEDNECTWGDNKCLEIDCVNEPCFEQHFFDTKMCVEDACGEQYAEHFDCIFMCNDTWATCLSTQDADACEPIHCDEALIACRETCEAEHLGPP